MAFSRFTALELDRHYPVSSREITVIPHGVNLSRFRPGSPCPNGTTKIGSHGGREPSLLFVAHNFFLKGLHCLLEVLGRLRKSGVEIPLRVAGSGPTGYFKRLAARHGIRSQVAFLGPMAQNDLVHLYRKSSVLVHPTFYDPCSLVVVEALASGCPVVTTRKNGASELFTSGREGIILDDPGDLGAMADTLLMLRDPRTLREMSQAALDLAPCLDVEKHMFEVMKWLGIERQAEAKG
jgi:UDP-glucose:(heptosyl)LPS alpha-1,3-glucosyltransferase